MRCFLLLIAIFSVDLLFAKPDISFTTKTIVVDGQVIKRTAPVIDGMPVEGADDVYSDNEPLHYTKFSPPSAQFIINAADAIEKALAHHEKSLIRNPHVEKIDAYFDKLWLMHFDVLRPAYKIRLPTLSIYDLIDIYIDGENGQLLRIENAAQFATAKSNVFVYSPTSAALDTNELRQVDLPNLVNPQENGFLQGEYVSVKTCCKYFTCPETGPCNDETRRCALRSHENARQTREILSVPTATLGLDPLMELPESVTVDTVRCTYLPFARASTQITNSNTLGFFARPIDEPGAESETDRFSEIQAYFSIMSFFNYIRKLLNDQTWCLRPEAMSCNSDGSPAVDDAGNPVNPYRVFVNQLIPNMKVQGPESSDPENFLNQAMQGKGTADNPIKLNQFIRIGNAAFVPALSKLKKTTPRADEILSDLIKPYDHNVFFQGDRDFAYDGDVVFHEFMHAITTSLIDKINSLGLDQWGIHSEPGSLNEGWADYFAAAFTGDPALGEYASIKGGYGEVALRNISNTASCPTDIIGEIHNDSLVWSGSLWAIRSAVKNKFDDQRTLAFDRAVLASLAQATETEDFATQSEKLINNIRSRAELGEEVARIAEEEFKARGVRNCFRAHTLSTVDQQNRLQTFTKNLMFVPSKNQINLQNYAPSTSQLEIGIPANAKSVKLTWKQYLGGTGALLGIESNPMTTKNALPLGIMKSFDVPIKWLFKGHSIPTRFDETITEAPEKAVFSQGVWSYQTPLNFSRCEQKTMYLSLLSNDFKYVVENLSVTFDIGNEDLSDCDFKGSQRAIDDKKAGCSHIPANVPLLLIMLLHATLRLRRKT